VSSIKTRELDSEIEKVFKSAYTASKSPQFFEQLLERAVEFVKKPPAHSNYVAPGIIQVSGNPSLAFIGDLHGDIQALKKVLKTAWSFIGEEGVVVFLGDYIDRGFYQLETLATVLLLKEEYCDRVILLRGNHEPPKWLTPYPHDYPYYLKKSFPDKAEELYELSLKLFEALPIAALQEGAFLAVHGGPPTNVLTCNSFECVFEVGKPKASEKLLEEVLWSDPVEASIEYIPSPRGAGVLYGTVVTERALRVLRVEYIVRGHEAVNGIRKSHGGRVLTVFSSPNVYELSCAGLLLFKWSRHVGYEIFELCI
jgi:protein phosphatase